MTDNIKAQRAAERVAANLASGTQDRTTSRQATLDQLGVERPRRRRRTDAARALAAWVREL